MKSPLNSTVEVSLPTAESRNKTRSTLTTHLLPKDSLSILNSERSTHGTHSKQESHSQKICDLRSHRTRNHEASKTSRLKIGGQTYNVVKMGLGRRLFEEEKVYILPNAPRATVQKTVRSISFKPKKQSDQITQAEVTVQPIKCKSSISAYTTPQNDELALTIEQLATVKEHHNLDAQFQTAKAESALAMSEVCDAFCESNSSLECHQLHPNVLQPMSLAQWSVTYFQLPVKNKASPLYLRCVLDRNTPPLQIFWSFENKRPCYLNREGQTLLKDVTLFYSITKTKFLQTKLYIAVYCIQPTQLQIGYSTGQDTLKPQDKFAFEQKGKTLHLNQDQKINLMNFFRGNFYQKSLIQNKVVENLQEAQEVIKAARKPSAGPNLNRYKQIVRLCVQNLIANETVVADQFLSDTENLFNERRQRAVHSAKRSAKVASLFDVTNAELVRLRRTEIEEQRQKLNQFHLIKHNLIKQYRADKEAERDQHRLVTRRLTFWRALQTLVMVMSRVRQGLANGRSRRQQSEVKQQVQVKGVAFKV